MKEIERKFHVISDSWKLLDPVEVINITQGYVTNTLDATTRIRTSITKHRHTSTLAIKINNSRSISRDEYEFDVPYADGCELLEVCETKLSKIRTVVMHDGDKWEIDTFTGDFTGFVMAEIELQSEDQPFCYPDWVGQELTLNPNFSNATIAGGVFYTLMPSPLTLKGI